MTQFLMPRVQAYAHSLILLSGESKWGDPWQDAGSPAEEDRQVRDGRSEN